ncbi:hypothetical protein PoB_001076300 [Plakobranchus ocellatus]|uniref:Uncharacterized protein n=1 Tax=Plakobranchus ocellatus TaxID=259542 RepID=A0AAV3YNW7_9GAST|nr:hypothetical protein PoB_001076300 [Plakobranchus ocellatus]
MGYISSAWQNQRFFRQFSNPRGGMHARQLNLAKIASKVALWIARTMRPTDVIDWDNVVKTLETTAGESDKIMRGLVDVYNVPKRLQKQVEWYLSMFLKRAVFLEIALQVVMYGLEANSDIETITGQSQDENSRGKMWDHFNSKSHFLHPIKLGIKEWIQPFCSQFMTTMMKKMYGFVTD